MKMFHSRADGKSATARTALVAVLLSTLVAACGAAPFSPPPTSRPGPWKVVALDHRGAAPITVEVHDESGTLVDAQPAGRPVLEANSKLLLPDRIAAAAVGTSVLVIWGGLACDVGGVLTVGRAGDTITFDPQPGPGCDLLGSYRGVILSFDAPRAPDSFRLTYIAPPIVGN